MSNFVQKMVFLITLVLVSCFLISCGQGDGKSDGRSNDIVSTEDLGVTIGSLVKMSWPESIRLEGYGLVVGLQGTGSMECPQHIRTYLGQHIQTLFPNRKIDVAQFIGGLDTAVVLVEGVMPEIASRNENFDVRVSALAGTQTTSLEGGWLLGTELKPVGTFGIATKIIANAKGTVYLDKFNFPTENKRIGYVLAGGNVLDEYKVTLRLKETDFRTTNIIRNRINELFGDVVAKVVLPGVLDVSVPAKYKGQKRRFVSIVDMTYLTHNPTIISERINIFTQKLAALQDADMSEIALEAVGNQSLEKLGLLLTVANEEVRLRAARCMLNLGSDAGLATLRQMTLDSKSSYRLIALESIAAGARRNDTIRISQRLLREDDIQVRLAAYEQLRKLEDISVLQELVGNNFYLEQVAQTPRKAIFVSRCGQPRVVLFGGPIECNKGTFVRSDDGNITINAPSGQSYVSVIRKHPRRPDVVLNLKSSFVLSDIIRTLCERPKEDDKPGQRGLGVPYADVISLLKQMCDKGAIEVEFWAGALPKIG